MPRKKCVVCGRMILSRYGRSFCNAHCYNIYKYNRQKGGKQQMIEDEQVKIAETKEESMWVSVVERLKNSITSLEKELIINKSFLAKAEEEAKKLA